MRNNQDLLKITCSLWREYFPDALPSNDILILFSRRNKRVLGSIKYDKKHKTTYIRINGFFQNKSIPLYVVKATIAHEIVHYVHGFSSPTKKLYHYPHQGGVVKQELARRGLASLENKSKKWLKNNWLSYLDKNRS